ncbi:50S ribosomal protein L4 [Phocicoccus pinnipedialis]|uniref:Large ribosomal subunit protein uL4 n=1 Tax=Phocicoccus pinnipedialis TaxID=110845 RepID=A0A6V7R4X0_9BACL|nr:50S ribosomal protein L4 [Jeotgalicoccus pinnipedialis]MBP1939813.1 large subunit ribosomal protein L4 [Jeotgalicoccus pinnipedialis]CAD2072467.1 50S ribosomal protein L4 [Jeotgalicoccus pinnipedialis]
MANVDVLSIDGSKVSSIELSDAVFGIEPNQHALFEAVTLQRASLRQGNHKVKNRSEVRGGGRKPFRQKGTGNARQGTIRAPHMVGGGVVFGPTPRSHSFKMPRKMRRLALRSALSARVNEEVLTVVDDFKLEAPKTKELVSILGKLGADKKALIVLEDRNEAVEKSANNLQGVRVITATGLNVLDILSADRVIFTEGAIKKAEEVLG